MSALGSNVIPSILQTNAQNESQSISVESVILDPANHTWVQDNYGKTTFNLPKKGSVLSPDGTLIWRTSFIKYDDGAPNKSATFPRLSGGACVLDTARLFVGGKLISETREVGQKIILDNFFHNVDTQTEIQDVKLASNHQFGYDADGLLKFEDGVAVNTKGTNCMVNGSNGENFGVECSVRIKDLFPMLKDMMLPMSLKGDILVEVVWKGQWADCIVEGSVAPADDTERGFKVARPRLHLDYVSYSNEVNMAIQEQVNSPQGEKVSYREAVLVKANIGAVGAGESKSTDIELGFNNRSVMKIYIQKLTGNNTQNRKSRSDGLLGEKHQLIVNNRQLYSRIVDNVSEMYSYLSQTGDKPYCNLDGTYNMVGDGRDNVGAGSTDYDTFNDNANNGGGAVGGQAEAYQGKFRYVGFNLAKTRVGNDTPSNSVNVGDAPLIVRIERSGSGRTNEQANLITAVDCNIWVECVKMMSIQNGECDVFEI